MWKAVEDQGVANCVMRDTSASMMFNNTWTDSGPTKREGESRSENYWDFMLEEKQITPENFLPQGRRNGKGGGLGGARGAVAPSPFTTTEEA